MKSILSLENVSKTIKGKVIVDGLSIDVKAGEIYGFLGPNGAGKTTTIRMIVGLIQPLKGKVRIAGFDVQKQRAQALAQVGTIVENPEMYSYLTARQNLIHYVKLAV
ncbi:ABC-type multidrug transport system ATPase subunit [Pullulanibacillus pueri]|uniref:ABC transporter domain-containing protein n=1 Tax=Pullulanibacillus pueri TaxID=1437324 RepID=A0A8J3ENL9_9BACL|nr:ATP-binding cassette domain-containing protein [Pullulanibacillus pueri]MBM7683689.1 ABC-type multidrug transport system ATPase subunit [Pullulanibacillus pueri]GGH87108.1 hypothetical protein GCM10007096_36360 [Pullulanibacillus pueri]